MPNQRPLKLPEIPGLERISVAICFKLRCGFALLVMHVSQLLFAKSGTAGDFLWFIVNFAGKRLFKAGEISKTTETF